ncbi:hypothetical protein WA026_021093 [Henosepilachna vigintioctopunctata]|uniref:Uncharacterized protein n=1 Tax=Henosepilachna vigintioctopunctata TaxID=420089 RepID=A0AAW1UXT6_9CUCU
MAGDMDVEPCHSAKNCDICEKLQSNSSYASRFEGLPILTGGTVKSVYQTAALVNGGRNNPHKIGVMLKSKDTSISNDYVLNELKKILNPVVLRIDINDITNIRNGVIVNYGSNESLEALEKSILQFRDIPSKV